MSVGLPEDRRDDESDIPPATAKEVQAILDLEERYPKLYEDYLEFMSKSLDAMIAITLHEDSKAMLRRERVEMLEDTLLLRIVRMDPKVRSNFMRQLSVGYEGAIAIGCKTAELLRSIVRGEPPPTDSHL